MRTIFIRHRPEEDSYAVVVKPHPGTTGTNLPHAETKAEAQEYADKLHAAFGWPIMDEA